MQKVCRDKCTTPQTIGKAILMAVLSFGFKTRMGRYTETIESVEYFESWSTGLKLIMLQEDLMFALNMFLWQHFIFIGFRIAFHLLMQILFCGCFCSEDEADEIAVPPGVSAESWDPFCEYLISF